MLAFVVGVLVGSGAAISIIGFLAAVDEEDERRYLAAQTRKRERAAEDVRRYGDM